MMTIIITTLTTCAKEFTRGSTARKWHSWDSKLKPILTANPTSSCYYTRGLASGQAGLSGEAQNQQIGRLRTRLRKGNSLLASLAIGGV